MLLYESLADEFAAQISAGHMHPGDRLPSVRHLAQQRQLSVSTVVQALRTLESRGMVEARPQSGYYVRVRHGRVLAVPTRQRLEKPVVVGLSQRLLSVLHANEAPGMVPFGSALPSPDLMVAQRLSRLYASVARRYPQLLSGTSHAALNEPLLLRAIVHRALEWGCAIAPEEVVVTNACTEAMSLCLRVVTKPGDTVAVEAPTYYVMLQLLESMGLRALEIPTDPQTGVSIEALDLATRERKIAACLLIPNAGNPLGCVMPDAHKQRVADMLASRNVPLIEDDIYGDICFTPARPRPVYAFDRSGNTMLCTSFSKTVSPAFRLGVVAAGKRGAEIALEKTLTSGKTNPLCQRVMAELLDTRGYDAHLRTLRRRLADQVARMRDAVMRHFPGEVRVTEPAGGLVLWVELPQHVDATELHKQAIARGIGFVPGEMFSANGRFKNHMRLACGHPWQPSFDDAIKTLGQMVCAASVSLPTMGP